MVNGDTNVEPNETFAVNLSGNSPGTAIVGAGSGTITNDDAAAAGIPALGGKELALLVFVLAALGFIAARRL